MAYAPISPQSLLMGAPKSTASKAAAPSAEGASAPAPSELEPDTPLSTTVQSLEQAQTPASAVRAMLPLLQRIGLHIKQKPTLLARACRLCYAAIQDAGEDQRLRDLVDTCIDCSLLPAITTTPANPGLVHELWRLLELLPTRRATAYGVLRNRSWRIRHRTSRWRAARPRTRRSA